MSARSLPVAEEWFRAVRVDDAITVIDEPHVHPFLRANIWHIRGSTGDVVIDCGLGVVPLRPAFPELLGGDPTLLLTHAHLDHMGSAHEFDSRWAHPLEPVAAPLPGTLDARALAATLGMGPVTDPSMPELFIDAVPFESYRPGDYRLRPAAATRALSDGMRIDLGDRALSVLHLPGHTPGSVAFYDEQNAALFSGDVIYDDELLDELEGSSVPDYLSSLARLRELPIDTVHPGHGPSFDGGRLHELIDAYTRGK
ncbi:MBL fold metallo-hydrolase [Pseudonocardia acaciae]|uniref:MBL fold metallo-hydrolase n=1 Tax=Pseudonocardia acaciae TaxID=551276 RepID=UPI0004913320|nr:MBL fold metallo-hydrolase [Pseudonocardia acaciae]